MSHLYYDITTPPRSQSADEYGRKQTPPFMADSGHSLSGGELGRPPPGLQLARATAGPRPGKHPRPAVVLSLGATAMEIRCTQISGFVDYCSLSVQSQRQRPCLENESQCCCVCGLSRGACSIGELRWRAGRFMHSSRQATANAFSVRRFIEFARVVKCNRIWHTPGWVHLSFLSVEREIFRKTKQL